MVLSAADLLSIIKAAPAVTIDLTALIRDITLLDIGCSPI